jgi:hypothetical protein
MTKRQTIKRLSKYLTAVQCGELKLGVAVPRSIAICCTVDKIIHAYNSTQENQPFKNTFSMIDQLFVICHVWTVDGEAADVNENLGIKAVDTNDRWMKYAFDLKKVRSFKECGPSDNGFIKAGTCTIISFSGDADIYCVVDISFEDFHTIVKTGRINCILTAPDDAA